jgi:hypothetical protein
MLRRTAVVAALLLASVAATPSPSPSTPLRHLVYSFTFDSKQNGTVPNDPGTSGASTYTGDMNDSGTVAVDVMREAQDRGLVVVVSEQAKITRSAGPATCAVYGNTDVACEPGRRVNTEEYALLRFLGANFVDPNKVDANGQWSVSESKGSTKMTAHYTINTNDNGVLSIGEARHVEDTSQGSTSFDAQTKLNYNGPKQVPTTVDEYATERKNGGVTGVYTTTYQTTLNLVSDSLSAKQ